MIHRDPWEQQGGESAAVFHAFSIYRDLGLKRTLRACAEKAELAYSTVVNWSSEWRWAERVAAWDREMDREARERLKLERGVTAARHYDVATKLLDLVEQKVDDMLSTENGFKELSVRDVKEWLAVLTPIQRLSMDMSTQINENRDSEAADATDAVRKLLENPEAARKAADLGVMLHGGEMVLSEHTRPEPVHERAAGAHLHVVVAPESGGETE